MKKLISLILTFMLIMSMFSAVILTSSAADLDDSKIYIKVDKSYYEVQKGDTIKYEYKLKYEEKKISSLDIRINYPDDVLEHTPYIDDYGDIDALTIFPITGYATVYNFTKPGHILFNYSNISGVRFMNDNAVAFCSEFKVITDTPGVYELEGYVNTLADVDSKKIVYEKEIFYEYSDPKSLPGLEPVYVEPDNPDQEPTDDTSDQTEPQTTPPSEDWTGSGPSVPLPPEGPTDPTDPEDPTDPTAPTEAETEEQTDPTEEQTEEQTDPTEEQTEEQTEPTEEQTEEQTEPTEEQTEEQTDPTEDQTEEQTEPTEKPTDEIPAATDEQTTPDDSLEVGYYLMGSLNGVDLWTVHTLTADRMFKINPEVEDEYILDWSFVGGDEIKVAHFDGEIFDKWYNSAGSNYKIIEGSGRVGPCTVHFNPEGNSTWSYKYIAVVPKIEKPTEVETDPTEEETEEVTDPTEEQTDETEIPTDEESIVPTGPDGTAPSESQPATDYIDPEKVYIRVDGKTLLEAEPNSKYTYTFYFACESNIASLDNAIHYDSDGLKFVPKVDEYGDYTAEEFPNFPSVVYNFDIEGIILYNMSFLQGVVFPVQDEFTDSNIMFEGSFDVTDKPGVYDIWTEFKTLADSEHHKIVYEYEVIDPDIVLNTDAELELEIPGESGTESSTDPTTPTVAKGDVNKDGELDVFDATIIQRSLVNYVELTDEEKPIADVNGDGEISIFDATIIQRYLAKYIESI